MIVALYFGGRCFVYDDVYLQGWFCWVALWVCLLVMISDMGLCMFIDDCEDAGFSLIGVVWLDFICWHWNDGLVSLMYCPLVVWICCVCWFAIRLWL